jgi:hypothetical protein
MIKAVLFFIAILLAFSLAALGGNALSIFTQWNISTWSWGIWRCLSSNHRYVSLMQPRSPIQSREKNPLK